MSSGQRLCLASSRTACSDRSPHSAAVASELVEPNVGPMSDNSAGPCACYCQRDTLVRSVGVVAMLSSVAGYIDASTGSYLLTAIAGGLATMWFFLRSKIDQLLGRGRRRTPKGTGSGAPEDSVAGVSPGKTAETAPPVAE